MKAAGKPRKTMTDEETLSEYLKTIGMQRPRHFDGTFVMGSYVPD